MENDPNIMRTAAQCRHYAMCKIDYLGTGLCPAGSRKLYTAYFPQGRMDLYDALVRGSVPVTEALLDIADTCTLCGICDAQCHFVTGMRPLRVMAALKSRVDEHRRGGGEVTRPARDGTLDRLRKIVGEEWATNDPAILAAYANDPFPLTISKAPRYVALPGSTGETASVVRLASREKIPYAVRGNGSSVYGQVFSDGIVMDMNRMKSLVFDPENWSVEVGPGVTSFELQREALERGVRVNAAEPAATVCGNIVCTGIFSPWSASYGLGADNVLDMEFVDARGRVMRLGDRGGKNLTAYRHGVFGPPGVCTKALVRLHPVPEGEEGLLVPFGEFAEAVRFAREVSVRRMGSAVAVLGPHYISTFISPSRELADRVKAVFSEDLGIRFGVFVVADGYGAASIRKMARSVIDGKLMKALTLGLPRLVEGGWVELLRGGEGECPPYEFLCRPEAMPLVEAVLDPSPETLASAVDEDLRSFYTGLYRRPELTDMVWLNSCRIVSARMGRHKHIVAFILFLPLDEGLIETVCDRFDRTAGDARLDREYGFLTPLDFGKRAVLEYDYYIDHTDPVEKAGVARAMHSLVPWLDELAAKKTGFTWMKTLFSQGFARKESFLYRDLLGRHDA